MKQNALAQRAFFLKQFDASVSHELVMRALDKLEHIRDACFYFQKAEQYRLKSKYALAVSYYEKTLKIDAEHEDALFFLGWCYLGNSDDATGASLVDDIQLSQDERNKRAELAYKRLIKMQSLDSQQSGFALCATYYNYSIALYRQNKLNEALDNLNRAVEIRENYGPAYSMLAYVKLDMHLYSEALRDCERAAELRGEDEHYFSQLGQIKSAIGKTAEAIENYLEAIDCSPRYIFPYIHLNQVYRQQGKYNEALKVIDNGIEEIPDYPDLYYFLAITEEEMDNATNAAIHYNQFLQRVPARAEWFQKHVERAHKRLQELKKPVD